MDDHQSSSPVTAELLSCPFCNGPADYVGKEGAGYNVQCLHCGAQSGWGDYGYQVEAKWNRRSHVRSSAGIEQASKCCRGLAPQSECQCEIERKAAGYPPYRRGGVAQAAPDREAVARIIDPTARFEDLEGVMWSRFELERRALAYQKADAILAISSTDARTPQASEEANG